MVSGGEHEETLPQRSRRDYPTGTKELADAFLWGDGLSMDRLGGEEYLLERYHYRADGVIEASLHLGEDKLLHGPDAARHSRITLQHGHTFLESCDHLEGPFYLAVEQNGQLFDRNDAAIHM